MKNGQCSKKTAVTSGKCKTPVPNLGGDTTNVEISPPQNTATPYQQQYAIWGAAYVSFALSNTWTRRLQSDLWSVACLMHSRAAAP